MHRLCVTPPKTTLGPGNLCPQLPAHSAPFHPFFKVSPDASKSDLVPTPSHSNLLSSILPSHRFSPLLLKTEQLLCRIPRPAGTTAKPAATKASFAPARTLQRMEHLQSSFPQLAAFSAPSAEDLLRPLWVFQQQLSLNTDPKPVFL